MALTITNMTDSDTKEVQRLFNRNIEELHKDRTEDERKHFKESYTAAKVKRMLKNPNSVCLVGREDGKLVGYVFGQIFGETGHIHWFSTARKQRGKGYSHQLLEKALSIFQKKHCHESRIFTYPDDHDMLRFLEGLGFSKRVSLEQEYLGISLVLYVKELTRLPKAPVKRLILAGEAGQGIKVMAHALANILSKLGKEVSLNLVYGTAVRGGEISAELIFSDEKIEVPFFDKADICLQLSRPVRKGFKADKQIIEEAILEYIERVDKETEDVVPFKREAVDRFGSPIFVNMIALGRLLNHIGIPIDKLNFSHGLPARFLEENVRAIKYGYTYQD